MVAAAVARHSIAREPALIFHDYTFGAGQQVSARQHDSKLLIRGAVELFHTLLEQHGDDFRAGLPHKEFARFELEWRSSSRGAALATFWVAGKDVAKPFQRVTTSALISGQHASDDRRVLDTLQAMMMQGFAGTPIEPGFEALAIAERPAIMSVVWPNPKVVDKDLRLVADMETCLAGAFFETC